MASEARRTRQTRVAPSDVIQRSPGAVVAENSFFGLSLEIRPVSIGSAEAFGLPKLAVTPVGISSQEAFGSTTLSGGGRTIGVSSIPSEEAFGIATVPLGAIRPAGIASAEAFGASVVPLTVAGIASAESFGTLTLSGGTKTIGPVGIGSQEAFGTLSIPIKLEGIFSKEEFGYPVLINGSWSIVSEEAFGTPTVRLTVGGVGGIPSGEAFGVPTLALLIKPSSIVSGELFGYPQVFVGTAGGASPFADTQTWTLFLAYSTSISPATPEKPSVIAELIHASSVRLEMTLNRPGSLNFTTIMDDERAAYILPVTTCIVAVRDGIVRWSGPVWTVDRNVSTGSINVGAVGWLDLMEHRQLREGHLRPEEDDDIRMAAIFALLNAQTDTDGNPQVAPLTYGGHRGLKQIRSADQWVRGNPAGNLINTLVEIERGFDLKVDPVRRILTTHREVILGFENQFPFYVEGLGKDRPNALFAYGLGADNLSSFTQRLDASTLANVINSVPDSGPAQQADDTDSVLQYGTFESDFPMTGTGIGVEILQAGATSEVFFRSQPKVTYDINPFPWTEHSSVPRLFDDYDIGDTIRFAAKREWLEVPANLMDGKALIARVFGASIRIDENGDERIESLQLAASSSIGVSPDEVVSSPPPPATPSTPSAPNTPPTTSMKTDSEAAAFVVRSSWEPRPQNFTANHRVPTAAELAAFRSEVGNASRLQAYENLITGNFTGTTDEIYQWAAHKWGLPVDIIRSITINESGWDQAAEGDHINGVPYSFGITQIKRPTGQQYAGWQGTYPLSQLSTAFNVDFWAASIRGGLDGHVVWMLDYYPTMDISDIWGWVGAWYSGQWYDQGAQNYINSAKDKLARRLWEQPGF